MEDLVENSRESVLKRQKFMTEDVLRHSEKGPKSLTWMDPVVACRILGQELPRELGKEN